MNTNKTDDLMTKPRWKHGNHSIEADMSVIVFKEELSDLYIILKERHRQNLLETTDAFELKMLMDGLTRYLGAIQKLASGNRKAYAPDRIENINNLKRVYKLLNIKY
jgi:hypothetical protein